MLTGVSVEYYARMERGSMAGVSPELLTALARALQLDEAEYDHLIDLAGSAGPSLSRGKRDHEQTMKPLDTAVPGCCHGSPYVGPRSKDGLRLREFPRQGPVLAAVE